METPKLLKPDYVFEVSWEVCNKVGGINTVLATKAKSLMKIYGDKLIMIGPDVWKGGGENPEFIEEKALLKSWKEHALKQGIKIKTGRWNIPGKPIAILTDFTTLFPHKNEIFADLWSKYHLDSITGQWDYIEPTLFGYAAGKVIENFYECHLNANDNIIAQFHEWMTGAGILYLKDAAPQVSTVFTTHATVLGRCIAGNGLPFYSRFDKYINDDVAREFNVVAKYSLEKLAAHHADSFTVVSDVTALECVKFLGKQPDYITYNGFDNDIVPDIATYNTERQEARQRLIDVSSALLNQKIPDDAIFLLKSGRYEFKNKGIDVFIDSLAMLGNDLANTKTIVGFIFVPANETGPSKELLERMQHPDFDHPLNHVFLTHYLQGADHDAIMTRINKAGITNDVNHKVKIIFAPVYLDGVDGIFNMDYYRLCIGFDLGIFPSYYEPFGYTPLECIAFHIPAITTDVSGFGRLVSSFAANTNKGVYVVKRTDDNEAQVVTEIAQIITNYSLMGEPERQSVRDDAFELSKSFLWENLLGQYFAAYSHAIEQSSKRFAFFMKKPQVEHVTFFEPENDSMPTWRNLNVQTKMPGKLTVLTELSMNLWYTWNTEAMELFEQIDAPLWEKCKYNAVSFLQKADYDKLKLRENDKEYIIKLNNVFNWFKAYLAEPLVTNPSVAYFSMEFGLTNFLKLYSGGLGILAGDYLKEASDSRLNISGVGILYWNGYFKQQFNTNGEQIEQSDKQDLATRPFQLMKDEHGNPLTFNLFFPARTIYVQIWKVDVGRVQLYLMDTNINLNNEEDRNLTASLYAGNNEHRLKQEILLGLGGIRMLHKLGINPDLYHCNEGHAALLGIERLRDLIHNYNLCFEEALEVVRASTLFTTHTSVPAANDTFSEDLLRTYLAHHAQYFNIHWDQFIALGRSGRNNKDERFSMPYLAAHIAQEINAVSKIHETVSRDLFNVLWKDYYPQELHIGHVTNGVHMQTWTAREWQTLYKQLNCLPFPSTTNHTGFDRKKIFEVYDSTIWRIRKELKAKLVHALHEKMNVNNSNWSHTRNYLNENALIIGFARRFVTYKRGELLFTNPERLLNIISNTERPVQIIFAGKAHPNDMMGKDIIRHIIQITGKPEFERNIFFIENYNIDLASYLVQGVDIWLNTPMRGMEASGTSGMKALLNGGLNLSILDGWWAEAYTEEVGWALNKAGGNYRDEAETDRADADMLYKLLENEIVPLYYETTDGIPVKWIKKIKSAISAIAPDFTMTRMVAEYKSKFYDRQYARTQLMKADNYALAIKITEWKKQIINNWNKVDVIELHLEDNDNAHKMLGENFTATVKLEIGRLSVADIGVEIIIYKNNDLNNTEDPLLTKELSLLVQEGSEATYQFDDVLENSGSYKYTLRIFPKNENLPHRQDFDLVKWI